MITLRLWNPTSGEIERTVEIGRLVEFIGIVTTTGWVVCGIRDDRKEVGE